MGWFSPAGVSAEEAGQSGRTVTAGFLDRSEYRFACTEAVAHTIHAKDSVSEAVEESRSERSNSIAVQGSSSSPATGQGYRTRPEYNEDRSSSESPARSFRETPIPPTVIPRTRLLIPVLLLISVAASGVTIWNTFFRFQAFGVVTGRLVEVSSPVDRVLQAVRYREGDDARQSDSLAMVTSIDTDHRLAEIDDRLRVHQARISATLTQLRFTSEQRQSEALEAAADASQAAAVLQGETGDLIVLQDHLSRLEKLRKASAGSEGERQSSLLKEAAASSRIEETRRAHGLLKERAQLLTETQRDPAILIEPLLAETELLLNEAERLRERQRLGEIRMPMNGTIIRRHHPTGEAVRAHEPLFTIVEESSLEIELFLTQSTANRFHVGDTLNVHLAPYQESVKCTVVAIGQELRAPPEQIQA